MIHIQVVTWYIGKTTNFVATNDNGNSVSRRKMVSIISTEGFQHPQRKHHGLYVVVIGGVGRSESITKRK